MMILFEISQQNLSLLQQLHAAWYVSDRLDVRQQAHNLPLGYALLPLRALVTWSEDCSTTFSLPLVSNLVALRSWRTGAPGLRIQMRGVQSAGGRKLISSSDWSVIISYSEIRCQNRALVHHSLTWAWRFLDCAPRRCFASSSCSLSLTTCSLEREKSSRICE